MPEDENYLTAYLNGEPDSNIQGNPEHSENDELTEAWEKAGIRYSYSAADPDVAWNNLQQKIHNSDNASKPGMFIRQFMKYAAAILVIAGIGFAAFEVFRTPNKVIETPVKMLVAGTGAHPDAVTKITLPDGSVVKLNANSSIEYPEKFIAGTRDVKLSGEAFFEVTKDSLHPFRIETTHAAVEVLGTSFNVSAYPEADRVEVNVETGKVRLSPKEISNRQPSPAILYAGKRGLLRVSDGEIVKSEMLYPNYASWLTRTISFQRTPLSEVCRVIGNTYQVNIRPGNPDIGRLLYTANFANLNSEYIIEVIARTHHLQIKKNGDELILAKR